jgi:hypothetical protein
MMWTAFFVLMFMAPMAVIAWREARQARQVLAGPRMDSELREVVERAAIGAEFTLTMTGIFAFLFLISWWVSA